LLWTWSLGLVPWLYQVAPGRLARPSGTYELAAYGPDAAVYAFWGAVVCYALVTTGTLVRPAIVLGILLEAQMGQVNPLAEQGVDHLVRTVLLILAFSGCDARWSIGPARRRDTVPGWPLDVVAWLLTIVYLASGLCKLIRDYDAWMVPGKLPATFRIMCDPLSGLVDPELAWGVLPLFRAMDWGTMVFELGAVVLLTRYARWWALMGVVMHVGLAATMKLGQFPYVVLAMYVVWFGEPFFAWLSAQQPVDE